MVVLHFFHLLICLYQSCKRAPTFVTKIKKNNALKRSFLTIVTSLLCNTVIKLGKGIEKPQSICWPLAPLLLHIPPPLSEGHTIEDKIMGLWAEI